MGAPKTKAQARDLRKGRQKMVNQHRARRQQRREADLAELSRLEQTLAEFAPPPGSNPLAVDTAAGKSYVGARKFTAMPLSKGTMDGLKQHKFVNMTAIQRATLPHALNGRDVLGGAKTGSGKTLAFIVPMLEALYRNQWTPSDGLAGLVISPTRELALQIFDELRKVGQFHKFSAGLLIGGKDVKAEQEHINGMNILVCTPGRLLQHMDETPYFDCSQLKILVLDEADRILDMGFSVTLNAIVANLPEERQTLLFSATLSKSVKDLARLSLKDPEYLSVHADAQAATPHKLDQFYSVVELHQKLDVLHSFVKTHTQCKMLVFLSTCKQVQFMNEVFCGLRPGVPVKCLHGKMKQMKRLAAFYEFCEAKSMVLFATDIAARGLDFPTVDWVIQVDCPEDVPTYIHRVGRTARFTRAGKAFLMLLPTEEEAFTAMLKAAKIPANKLTLNPKQQARSIKPALQSMLSRDVAIKEAAQKATVAYIRSVFLQPNKEVFSTNLPITAFAESLGLPSAPRMRFLHVSDHSKRSSAADHSAQDDHPDSEEEDMHGHEGADASRVDATLRASGHRGQEDGEGDDESDEEQSDADNDVDVDDGNENSDSEDDFMVVKRRNHKLEGADSIGTGPGDGSVQHLADVAAPPEPRASKKKKKLKVKLHASGDKRVVFDDEGVAKTPLEAVADVAEADVGDLAALQEAAAARFKEARQTMMQRDKADRRREKERLRASKQDRKRKMKEQRASDQGEETEVVLGNAGGESDSEGSGSDQDAPEKPYARRKVNGGTPSSGEDSDGDVRHRKAKRQKETQVELAHMGMKQKMPKKSVGSMDDVSSMEALALKMIRQRK